MTVQTDSGYVDYGANAGPPMPQGQQSGGTRQSAPATLNRRSKQYKYRRGGPQMMSIDLWGKNGYYMNGPAVDPFDRAGSMAREIDAYTRTWQDPAKAQAVKRFNDYLYKYGHTNSPGVLWSMALSDIPDTTSVAQSLLKEDAAASASDAIRSAPVLGQSPAAMNQENNPLDQFWQPVETIARNAFAALSMPVEALQGAVRGAGGELTNEQAPWFDMQQGRISGAVAQLGSLVVPPVSLWADRVRGDNNFVNPWEQTEFGQTLLSMAGGAGLDAFYGQQAGLDLDRAKNELRQDPQYAQMEMTPDGIEAFNAAAETLAKDKGYYGTPGWFINETSQVGEAQRRATFQAWGIPGPEDQLTAWTLGRGIAANVVGPDSAAYGVMSGLIDAVAIVAGDPTIWGGKFGIVSKSLRGIGRLAEMGGIQGAEKALLIGKERKAVQQAWGLTNLEINRAIEMANDARKKAGLPQITINERAAADVLEMAPIVREAKIAEKTDEYKSAMRVNTKLVADNAKTMRRAAGRAATIDESILRDIRQAGDPAESAADTSLWQDLMGVRTTKQAEEFLQYLRQNPEEAARRNRLMSEYNVMYLSGDYGDTAEETARSFDDFLRILESRKGAEVARPADIPADKVQRDMARVFSDPNAEGQAAYVASQDYDGLVLANQLMPDRPMMASIEGKTGIAYWAGEAAPVFAAADDLIQPDQAAKILAPLTEFLSRPGMSGITTTFKDIGSPDSMTAQTLDMITRAADPREALANILSSPSTTFRQLLQEAAASGTDSILDDILRSELGIDGIYGIDPGTKTGAWMGNHPMVIAYGVSPEARQVGKDLGAEFGSQGIDFTEAAAKSNFEDALSQIDFSNISSDILDLRGMGLADLQQMAYDQLGKSGKVRAAIDKLAQNSVLKAKTKEEALAAEIARITAETDDPQAVLRNNLQYLGGMRNTKNGGLMLDQRGVREFLFGRGPASFLANRAFDAIAGVLSPEEIKRAQEAGKFADDFGNLTPEYRKIYESALGRLGALTRNKWFPDTYQAVAEAIIDGAGREGVLNVLSTRLGIDVTQGSVSRTAALMAGDGPREFQSWRKLSAKAERALGQMPTARTINLQKASEVVESITMYARYAGVSEERIASLVGRVYAADGTMEAIGVNRNALADAFDDMSDTMLARLDSSGAIGAMYRGSNGAIRKQEIKSAIRSSTRLWMGGETDASKRNVEILATMSDVNRVLDTEGNEFILPDITLETELASGTLALPSVDDWSSALSRFHAAVARLPRVQNLYEFGRRFFDNVFRAGMLVFRISYVLRNVGEMQIRMFMNGHHSILSDPMTMIGMTLGSHMSGKRIKAIAKEREEVMQELIRENRAAGRTRAPTKEEIEARMTPRNDFFADLFAGPYKDTILGTDFEVGDDINLAIANGVEDYFVMQKMSHALTDPRVYNSAVRQGWQYIEYGTPKFNYGWAHELQMLHGSPIVQVMLGPQATREIAGYDRKAIIDFLTSMNPEAIGIRRKMIGADRKYEQIFNDQKLMQEWLFDSVNSVQNRIVRFTDNDPTLIEYLRTGIISPQQGVRVNVRSISDLDKRIRELGGILGEYYNRPTWETHFKNNGVKVPWVEPKLLRHGSGFFDWFFDSVAMPMERIGAVGPEFRMSYWDKVAELAPGLRRSDVDRALKAARTTLSPIKRMKKDGALDSIGGNHPAFKALEKAKKENSDGLLTLDEIHDMAMQHAGRQVQSLFYDAAKRNKFWYGLRLIFPFGQAWGNTVTKWGELGAKAPIQVYKIQKAINAMLEEDSNSIYEAGQAVGAYGDYPPGLAPWDQNSGGGFFYTDSFGETSFMYPFVGRLQAAALNVMGAMRNGFSTGNFSGPGIGDIGVQSPASSLNVALGADSIFPGISTMAGTMLQSQMLPDWDVIDSLRRIAMPFGEKNMVEAAVPAWFSKILAGIGFVPGVGDVLASGLDYLAPANKEKHVNDAMFILSTSGNYPNWATDPHELQRMQEDAKNLAKGLLLTTGLIQNVLPSTPYVIPTVNLGGEEYKGKREVGNPQLYAIGVMNVLFQQYLARNNRDYTAAHEEFVKDFGPSAIFAAIGDWQAFGTRPTTQALQFARKYPEIAQTYADQFSLFFPGGDSSDAAAIAFMRDFGSGVVRRKTVDEISTGVITTLKRIQIERVRSMEAEGLVSNDQADEMRAEIEDRYLRTDATTGVFKDKTQEMEQLNAMVEENLPIRNSQAGQAFAVAWTIRQQALDQARRFTGDPKTTLRGKKVADIKEWLVQKMFDLEDRYPDFVLLSAKFRKEWD